MDWADLAPCEVGFMSASGNLHFTHSAVAFEDT